MGSNSSFLIMMVMMVVVWYFLIIRPQQQRTKRHRDMVNNLKKGDQVITQGGIYGKIAANSSDENQIEVEIASGVKVKLVRSTIQSVLNKQDVANSNAKPAPKTAQKSTKKPASKK